MKFSMAVLAVGVLGDKNVVDGTALKDENYKSCLCSMVQTTQTLSCKKCDTACNESSVEHVPRAKALVPSTLV